MLIWHENSIFKTGNAARVGRYMEGTGKIITAIHITDSVRSNYRVRSRGENTEFLHGTYFFSPVF